MIRLFVISGLILLPVLCISQFQEYTSVLGAEVTNPLLDEGNGVSFADFNMDGWDDISLVRKNLPPLFFLNNQNGFEPVDLNILNEPAVNQKGILWADYDNDGDRDLLITQKFHPVKLYRNDGDLYNMTEVTAEVGLAQEDVWNSGASWVDYDRDGFLDLYICKFHTAAEIPTYIQENHMYRNLGDGTFEDVTLVTGISDGFKPSFQSVFLDYNNDLWPDLYVINDRMQIPNSLYKNNGNGTFSNMSAQSGTNVYIDAMCGSVADYDHDGDLDIFVSNTGPDVLLRNNGNNTFVGYGAIAGVNSDAHGWGGLWIDYNNDSWQDLFVCNQDTDPNSSLWPNNFFLNEGDGTFIHYEEEAGLGNDDDASFAVARADYDRDGWEDFFTHNADESSSSLWKNQSWQNSSNHWIQVKLQGVISNRDAVGTWLHLYLPDDELVRYTVCGDNYLSQDSFVQHFGLGGHTEADSVKIVWPSGLIEVYHDLPADQLYAFIEGATYSAALNEVATDTLCAGDSVLLYLNGFNEVIWSTNEVADSIYADSSGWYFASGFTPEGLEVLSDSVYLTFTPPISVLPMTTDVLCYGDSTGTVSFEIDGGTPEYLVEVIDQNDWDHLSAGSYEVHCFDELGCTAQTSFQVNQPDILELSYEDLAMIDPDGCGMYHEGEAFPVGGTPPYSFEWEFTGPGPDFPLYFSDATYTCVPNDEDVAFVLIVTDANGCMTALTDVLEVFMGIGSLSENSPLLFPNPFESKLTVQGMGIQDLHIYNAVGKHCFAFQILPFEQRTTLHLPQLPAGIYTCILRTDHGNFVYRLMHH